MKFMSLMFALLCATAALAKSDAGLFNQAIREGIKQEAKKDGVVYKVAPGRAPASVEATKTEVIQNEHKSLDKVEKQYKQLGSPKW
jgi:ABC-type sugar transport system substrate-binding protein